MTCKSKNFVCPYCPKDYLHHKAKMTHMLKKHMDKCKVIIMNEYSLTGEIIGHTKKYQFENIGVIIG